MRAFVLWITNNWDHIVAFLIWGFSILAAFLVIVGIYKVFLMRLTTRDFIGLLFGVIWGVVIFLFGFDNVQLMLENLM